jgi:hypothetical protein
MGPVLLCELHESSLAPSRSDCVQPESVLQILLTERLGYDC